MPPIPPRPRIPGSQVAPGQRPYNRDAPTASTHSKIPIHEATAGELFRVRDKDWVALHGEELTWDEANRLKEQVVSAGHRTARVENMRVEPPDWYQAEIAHEQAYEAPTAELELGHAGPAAQPLADPQLEAMRARAVHAGAAAASAANMRVSDAASRARAAQLAAMTGSRPVVVTIPDAPVPVVPAPAPKQAKFVAPPPPKPKAVPPENRVVHRDKTVQATVVRRDGPPPRDKTVASEILRRASAPPSADPRPMISPLKAAMMADDIDIPDDLGIVGDDDLSDLVSDVGGGATDKDVERAKAQADSERRTRGQG